MKLTICAIMFGTAAGCDICCNPYVTPAQMCPGGFACEECGGSAACECPGQPPPPPPGPPAPTPPPYPAVESKRLTVVNGCSSGSMWIAHIAGGGVGPDEQDLKISPGQQAKFTTSTNGGLGGLSATRYWPKMGCDETGNHCSIGDSGGPAEGCVIRIPGKDDNYTQCAPPVDTKFEATFAAPGWGQHDVLDMSLVDGYTLPFKLEVTDSFGAGCTRDLKPFESMDCSELSLSNCPTTEVVGSNTFDLRAVNPKTGELAGCFSPCKKVTDDKWNETLPIRADSQDAGPYCCAGAYGNPQECSSGPIMQSNYLPAVKAQCPNAYGYPYDDHIATIACETTTEYVVTFYCAEGEVAQLSV